MKENIKTVGAGLTGVVLTAVAMVSLSPNESPNYVKEGEKIRVERTICEPHEFVGTKEEMIKIANTIQANIDARKILGVDVDQKTIDMLEGYKARFIEDSKAEVK